MKSESRATIVSSLEQPVLDRQNNPLIHGAVYNGYNDRAFVFLGNYFKTSGESYANFCSFHGERINVPLCDVSAHFSKQL